MLMDASLCDAPSKGGSRCRLDDGCCMGLMPPLTQKRIGILLANGVSPEEIEFDGYKRLRLKPNGFCALFENVKCRIHSVKPETELVAEVKLTRSGLTRSI